MNLDQICWDKVRLPPLASESQPLTNYEVIFTLTYNYDCRSTKNQQYFSHYNWEVSLFRWREDHQYFLSDPHKRLTTSSHISLYRAGYISKSVLNHCKTCLRLVGLFLTMILTMRLWQCGWNKVGYTWVNMAWTDTVISRTAIELSHHKDFVVGTGNGLLILLTQFSQPKIASSSSNMWA